MPHEDLELLKVLEAGDAAARRRAIWISWSSVSLAAIILAALVFLGYRRLGEVQEKVAAAKTRVATLESREKTLRQEVEQLQATKANLELIAQNYRAIAPESPVASHEERVAAPISPQARSVQPRVFLQIVNPNDRVYAQEMTKPLEQAGFKVLGIETVERAAGLKNTEVRYYKKADQPGCIRLLDALRGAGVKSPAFLYLGLENNRKVRPKTYEVWFADGVGQERSPG
jgi:cell division protein FtsB